MKKMAFIVLFLYCTLLIYPQAMNMGSAKKLEGNIYVLTCFANHSINNNMSNPNLPRFTSHHDNWSYNQKINMLREKDRALRWIKAEALKYGITVDFIEDVYGLEEDFIYSYPYEQKNDRFNDSIDTVLGSMGRVTGLFHHVTSSERINNINNMDHDAISFYDYVKNIKNCDNFLVLLLAGGDPDRIGFGSYAKRLPRGRAFSEHNTTSRDERYRLNVEGVVIYNRGRPFTPFELTPYETFEIIAHEILHCFGAWDLYESQNRTAGARMARERFPDSIMNDTIPDKFELGGEKYRRWIASPPPRVLDPLTAWRIGWNKNPEPWFQEANPHD